MVPPFLSYVTFNRLGLVAQNLKSILDTDEEFEMHIIDNHSQDDTWEYLLDVDDSRIRSKTRLSANIGPIFAANLNLTKRKPEQYFITVDTDVKLKTRYWISRFMEVFRAFPETGLLGVVRGRPYPQLIPPVTPRARNGVTYLELKNGFIDEMLDFVHGCCQCLRPELIREIGYWSEENGYGDAELSPRVKNYTSFNVGFMTDIYFQPLIDFTMYQNVGCGECIAKDFCKLNKEDDTCFTVRNKYYKNESFANKFHWKYIENFKDLSEGKRTAYCASLFDPKSRADHPYNLDWALENLDFYAKAGTVDSAGN